MKIIRSNRKSFALEIKPREGLIVCVPLRATQAQVKKFIDDHRDWIKFHLEKMREKQASLANVDKLSMDGLSRTSPERLKY